MEPIIEGDPSSKGMLAVAKLMCLLLVAILVSSVLVLLVIRRDPRIQKVPCQPVPVADFPSEHNVKARTNIDLAWIAAMEKKYFKINMRISERCQAIKGRTYNNSNSYNSTNIHGINNRKRSIIWENIMYEPFHNLAFCRNAKVGTTTWMAYFQGLLLDALDPYLKFKNIRIKRGLPKERTYDRLHTQIPYLFKLPLEAFQSGSKDCGRSPVDIYNRFLAKKKVLSFTFVRHPLERLISTYESKIIYSRTTRPYLNRLSANSKSFPDFVDFVVGDLYQNNCDSGRCDVDRHWQPFSARCMYCDLHYDVIGKMEHFAEDVQYIFFKQGLFVSSPHYLHLNNNEQWEPSNRQQRLRHYISMLSPEQIEQVYEAYKLDFDLFGYEIP